MYIQKYLHKFSSTRIFYRGDAEARRREATNGTNAHE
jgi:hypothetical protein